MCLVLAAVPWSRANLHGLALNEIINLLLELAVDPVSALPDGNTSGSARVFCRGAAQEDDLMVTSIRQESFAPFGLHIIRR